jgi:hypothetical protein
VPLYSRASPFLRLILLCVFVERAHRCKTLDLDYICKCWNGWNSETACSVEVDRVHWAQVTVCNCCCELVHVRMLSKPSAVSSISTILYSRCSNAPTFPTFVVQVRFSMLYVCVYLPLQATHFGSARLERGSGRGRKS